MDLFSYVDNIGLIRDVDSIRICESDVENPMFTIAVPTYKRAGDLQKTIASAIHQKCDCPYEIVVVDNHPERNDETENLIAVCPDHHITYVKNLKNVGMVGNWNKCLLLSRGEWVMYCHDDDTLTEDALQTVCDTIRAHPECRAVTSRFVPDGSPYTSENSRVHEENVRGRLRGSADAMSRMIIREGFPVAANLFCDNIFGPPTCGLTVNRKTLMDFGGWREHYLASDWVTMIGFAEHFKVMKPEKVTGIYVWKRNTSLKKEALEAMSKERAEILRALRKKPGICRFYSILLKKDLDRKQEELLTEHDGKKSRCYQLLKKYYMIRIRK